jgi:hypothetical protein
MLSQTGKGAYISTVRAMPTTIWPVMRMVSQAGPSSARICLNGVDLLQIAPEKPPLAAIGAAAAGAPENGRPDMFCPKFRHP